MADCFKTYNKTLKELIDLISNDLPKNSLADDIKRKFTAAVSTDRTILLTETGKELFVYRDYISEGRWDELINKNWESESQNAHIQDLDSTSISDMIRLLKNIWNNYDNDEKKYVKKLIKTLLSEYTKYLISKQ